MKRIDVILLFMVLVISVLLFLLLQGKVSNGYIVLIILGLGLVVGFVRRFFLKTET
ncbi:MAG: hypothetical protein ABF649_06920 [Bacillus sp. (in: firmicutes)]